MFVYITSIAHAADNLLPKPQQIIVKGGSLTIGKVILETKVLQTEWEKFI